MPFIGVVSSRESENYREKTVGDRTWKETELWRVVYPPPITPGVEPRKVVVSLKTIDITVSKGKLCQMPLNTIRKKSLRKKSLTWTQKLSEIRQAVGCQSR